VTYSKDSFMQGIDEGKLIERARIIKLLTSDEAYSVLAYWMLGAEAMNVSSLTLDLVALIRGEELVD